MLSIRRPDREELDGTFSVWLAANEARGRAPSAGREARVCEKLVDRDALLVVAVERGLVLAWRSVSRGVMLMVMDRRIPSFCMSQWCSSIPVVGARE